ncbi:MAG: hypothetical protein AB8F34_05735 [Akkermansiaceae bacterium]
MKKLATLTSVIVIALLASISIEAATQRDSTCTINGTLTVEIELKANQNSEVVPYTQWNNVKVELHRANDNFKGRYDQLIAKGYKINDAMKACMREDKLWKKTASTITKPTKFRHRVYSYGYSWFGFVGLKPGIYRVVIPGRPSLTRWVSFTAGGQKVEVNLKYKNKPKGN